LSVLSFQFGVEVCGRVHTAAEAAVGATAITNYPKNHRRDILAPDCGNRQGTSNAAFITGSASVNPHRSDGANAFFRAVGAPDWHGRNLDALADSISGSSINQVEVPYRLVIKSYDKVGSAAKPMTDSFIALIQELAVKGCPVEIDVEGQ
jgi:RNAse (barnase) inhibitor barstar